MLSGESLKGARTRDRPKWPIGDETEALIGKKGDCMPDTKSYTGSKSPTRTSEGPKRRNATPSRSFVKDEGPGFARVR